MESLSSGVLTPRGLGALSFLFLSDRLTETLTGVRGNGEEEVERIWHRASLGRYCLIPLTSGTWKRQIDRDKKQNPGFQGLREGGEKGDFSSSGYGFCLGGGKFGRRMLAMIARRCEYT